MGAYDTPPKPCPYCSESMEADWVDVGVGMVQCGPYHCEVCGASEMGPEFNDWFYKDRQGETIYLPSKRVYSEFFGKRGKGAKGRWGGKAVLRYDHPFTKEELETGFYQGRISPYANTINGVLVDHETAHRAYRQGILDENPRKKNHP